jgi:hypothetical protein
MTRQEQIKKVANEKLSKISWNNHNIDCFISGAEWADSNPSPVQGELIGALNSRCNVLEEKLMIAAHALRRVVAGKISQVEAKEFLNEITGRFL